MSVTKLRPLCLFDRGTMHMPNWPTELFLITTPSPMSYLRHIKPRQTRAQTRGNLHIASVSSPSAMSSGLQQGLGAATWIWNTVALPSNPSTSVCRINELEMWKVGISERSTWFLLCLLSTLVLSTLYRKAQGSPLHLAILPTLNKR